MFIWIYEYIIFHIIIYLSNFILSILNYFGPLNMVASSGQIGEKMFDVDYYHGGEKFCHQDQKILYARILYPNAAQFFLSPPSLPFLRSWKYC